MSVFARIAIIGCGLIGGSIARAATEKGAAAAVSLYDFNADALKRAGEIGIEGRSKMSKSQLQRAVAGASS